MRSTVRHKMATFLDISPYNDDYAHEMPIRKAYFGSPVVTAVSRVANRAHKLDTPHFMMKILDHGFV